MIAAYMQESRSFPARARSILWRCGVLAAFGAGAVIAPAQTTHAGDPAQEPTAVLQTGTKLVVVDVIVQDAKGHPVKGLTVDNFHLEEGKIPQRMRNFEAHSADDAPKARPPAPKLPAGTFTDYTPAPAANTLNILLIDALNTPLKDQNYLRSQLRQYAKTAPSSQPVAIFGLNSRLYLLQGFTSDPEILRDAVNHKLIPQGSALLDDPGGTNKENVAGSEMMADLGPGLDDVVANMQQFEAETQAFQLQARAQYTLDAMNALAQYLQNFPGRKNLIWFSGSFPLSLLPDPAIQNGFSVMQLNESEFRETTRLLTRAQVAVYPMDARGVTVAPMYDVANSGHKYTTSPTAMGKDITKFDVGHANENITMDQMAADTGGHAYYGTNNLAEAVTNAVDSGSNYYTLTYSPTNRDAHGEYRAIHVSLSGANAPPGLQLSYRHGYYADEPDGVSSALKSSAESAASTQNNSTHAAEAYTRIAMSRGAPAPQDVLFQVRVHPVSQDTEAGVAPGNQMDPTASVKGPFRRYAVDFAAVPDDFTFAAAPNGHHIATIAFRTYVFDPDGKLLITMARGERLDLPPAQYEQIMAAGVGMHLEVSAPARGESYFRIAVQDVPTNKIGVVELSTARIDRLASTPAATQP